MAGKGRKESFANKVRQSLISLGHEGRPVKNSELADALDLVGDQDKRQMYTALYDMAKAGEVERVEHGVYVYRGKTDRKSPEIREAMWAVVRMRKTVTLEDLQELTGATKSYAREFMCLLAVRGVVDRISRPGNPCLYRLAQDTGPVVPDNDEKAAKLRRIREAKKRAIEEIDAAGKALMAATEAFVRVRMTINDIPEDTEEVAECVEK